MFSSGIFDTPPSHQKPPRPRKSWYKGGPYDSWTILGSGPPTFPDLHSNNSRFGKNMSEGYIDSTFIAAQRDPVKAARGDLLHRRQFANDSKSRRDLVFFAIVVMTIFFPPAGVLALYSRFNTTISWYTHGELHDLSSEHRGILKQQLFIEALVYSTLIITLAVYYSLHH